MAGEPVSMADYAGLEEDIARTLWGLFYARYDFPHGQVPRYISLNVRDRAGDSDEEKRQASMVDMSA